MSNRDEEIERVLGVALTAAEKVTTNRIAWSTLSKIEIESMGRALLYMCKRALAEHGDAGVDVPANDQPENPPSEEKKSDGHEPL